mgnify:CR=1 FL=1
MKSTSLTFIAVVSVLFAVLAHATPQGMHEETWQYDRDPAGNIIRQQDTDSSTDYGYDPLHRLESENPSSGADRNYQYDPIGNRLTDTVDGQATDYVYPPQNSHLQSKGSESYSRDAVGNTISDRSGNRTFTYTPDNRLHKVFEDDQLIATYTYNALGQRSIKRTAQGTTYYLYGLDGKLLGEYDENGEAIKEYVYLEGEPLAILERDDSITYLHTDHLGTPRRATDETGEVVWSWESDAFGNTSANSDPNRDGQNTIVDLRFPGQYYDQETGLHYNWQRYFDPQTGRFLTSDPRGLDDGPNTYAYVRENPINYYDPTGEISIHAGRAVWYGSYNLIGKRFIAPGINSALGYLTGTASLGALIYNITHNDPDLTAPVTGSDGGTASPQCPPDDPLCLNQQQQKIHNTYPSANQCPNYPQGFRATQNGTKNFKVNNQQLLQQLRQQHPGTWHKVYQNGYTASGQRVSLHYFRHSSGRVFNLKIKNTWSTW